MISIIIPAHNELDNLQKLLPRLGELTTECPDTEVLLALSGSNTDETRALPSLGFVKVLDCPGTGRALQMNTAARASTGKTLVFLHADVMPPDGFIDNIRDTMAKGYKAGFFSYRFDSDRWLLKLNSAFTGRDGLFAGGGDQCLFIEREAFIQLGGFNQDQVLMEDFEFFRRMKRHKLPYLIVKNDLLVSARKYQYNSYWRVNLANLLLLVLFRLGFPATRLKKLHQRMLRLPYHKS